MSHKILIIDDEPEIREMLKLFLTKLGYEVTTAQSGYQGIEKIKSEPFSLVLCDVMMEGLDGLKTLAEIKKINNSLPIIMISGLGTHDRIIQALQNGASDFIAKPFNLIQIKRIIQQAIKPEVKASDKDSSSIAHLVRESYLGLLRMMIKLLEARDSYIKDHSTRVAEYAVKIAQLLNLSEDTIEVINYAGILHDIGKIGVSDVILLKPTKLTIQEWGEIKMHPTIGSMIVGDLRLFRAEEPLIRHHHEWYDGTGYPDSLKKEDIPLGARIISVADAYDAMTSPRPYRAVMDNNTAKNIIKEYSNKQFDPKLAEVFLSIV
jgi:response regulator RpfG family c-di-GMP phosphodiesterase